MTDVLAEAGCAGVADSRGDEARDALERLEGMIRIRRFEERCAELYQQEKIRGFLHLYIGEEAVATGVMRCLGPGDAVVATYREHGHALARGVSADRVMAEMYGRQEGCSAGRGGSMHLFDAATRFYGGNAIVAGGLPVAAGLALADAMRGEPRVTVCFFGDGAVAEGVFHETMNLASLWRLPLLFVCENNRYAMGTALERHQSETDLAHKAESYRVASASVDGMDVEAVERETRRALDAIRCERRPQFLEMRTYRFRAHSMFDPDQYRDRREVEDWMKRCPVETYARVLRERGVLDEATLAGIEQRVAAVIDGAVAFAEAGTWEPVETLARWVTRREEQA